MSKYAIVKQCAEGDMFEWVAYKYSIWFRVFGWRFCFEIEETLSFVSAEDCKETLRIMNKPEVEIIEIVDI